MPKKINIEIKGWVPRLKKVLGKAATPLLRSRVQPLLLSRQNKACYPLGPSRELGHTEKTARQGQKSYRPGGLGAGLLRLKMGQNDKGVSEAARALIHGKPPAPLPPPSPPIKSPRRYRQGSTAQRAVAGPFMAIAEGATTASPKRHASPATKNKKRRQEIF